MLISIKDARSLLPRVGDVRREIPTIGRISRYQDDSSNTPMECVVVAVHPGHLWYRVRFKDSGFTECYKVPRLKLTPGGRLYK